MPKYLFFLIIGITAIAVLLVLRRFRSGPRTAIETGELS
jgi:hypothetical protein